MLLAKFSLEVQIKYVHLIARQLTPMPNVHANRMRTRCMYALKALMILRPEAVARHAAAVATCLDDTYLSNATNVDTECNLVQLVALRIMCGLPLDVQAPYTETMVARCLDTDSGVESRDLCAFSLASATEKKARLHHAATVERILNSAWPTRMVRLVVLAKVVR